MKNGSRFLAFALAIAVAFAPSSIALQQTDVDRELEDAKALYREAKFAQAIAKLQAAIAKLEPLRDAQTRRLQLPDAHLYLGLSYVALNDRAAAMESFKQVLRLDPSRKLDPDVYAPKVVELFEQAREEVAKEPVKPPATAAATPPTAPPARKGRSKTLPILLGVGGVATIGAGVAIAGGSVSNAAPTAAGINVEPADSVGIVALTDYRFSAIGPMDPDGDALQYLWDFGDGASSVSAGPSHRYQVDGSFLVKLTLSDGRASSTVSTTLRVVSLTGHWSGYYTFFDGMHAFSVAIEQSGSAVTAIHFPTLGSGQMVGELVPPRSIALHWVDFCNYPEGQISADGNRIDGRTNYTQCSVSKEESFFLVRD